MLHSITRKQFLSRLRRRKVENITTITLIERSLRRERGYVFRMPKKGTSVILLLSGGLDSIVCWGLLMEEFGLHVYPLSIDKGEKRAFKEKVAIEHYSRLYKQRYPDLYHMPTRVMLDIKDVTLQAEEAQNKLHPAAFLDNIIETDGPGHINVSLGSFLLLPIYAKLYAELLFATKYIKIRTIFCTVTASDGLVTPYQTFTAMRSAMYHLSAATGDNSWQFASAIFEKEIGLYFDKKNLVLWAHKHAISLEHTWTCSYASRYQCGGSNCRSCIARRYAFKQAKVEDKTIYQSLVQQSIVGRSKRLLRRLLSLG